MGSVTAYKAGDLAIEHNVDIHPALFAVELLPTQCLEAFQFHSVLVKDVESVIKGFFSNKAPSYDKVSASVGRLRNSSQYENVYITEDYAKAIQMERKVLFKAMFLARKKGMNAEVVETWW